MHGDCLSPWSPPWLTQPLCQLPQWSSVIQLRMNVCELGACPELVANAIFGLGRDHS